MSFSIELPLRIESEMNAHQHWRHRARRADAHRNAAVCIPKHKLPGLPCIVTLTRIAPRRLDGDNLQSGFKALRDGIADKFGIDDRDSRVTWLYEQERGQPKTYSVRIQISPRKDEVRTA